MRHVCRSILFVLLVAGCTGTDVPVVDPKPEGGLITSDAGITSDTGDGGDVDVVTVIKTDDGDPCGTNVTNYTLSPWAGGAGSGLSEPAGIAFDRNGNLYVANNGNATVNKITPDGNMTTLAGTGECHVNGVDPENPDCKTDGYQDGNCANATFGYPQGIAVDQDDNVFVADIGNNVIRKITISTTACTVNKAASDFVNPWGVKFDDSGNMYVADTGNNRICRVTANGMCMPIAGTAGTVGFDNTTLTTQHATFNKPVDMVTDTQGNMYVADYNNNAIRKISLESGEVSTCAGSGPNTPGLVDRNGPIAAFNAPEAVAIDACGNLYVADSHNNAVRKVSPAGDVVTIAGTDPANPLSVPAGVAVDASGVIYVADQGKNRIVKLTPTP
jgi:sugar lactone lactonase YvrE